ncbi:MAG: complex I NDUFA9 subunit family protein [Burkholderiales bacterium]
MMLKRICIIGGSGFVGRHIAGLLVERGYDIRVLTRDRERAKHLLVLPSADVIPANVHDTAVLQRQFAGMDAIINLVGILHESRKNSFDNAHVQLTQKVLDACRAVGVKRVLHMSALAAAPDAPSAYLRSKAEAEKRVLAFSQAGYGETTIFRPSVIFGQEDSFINLFAKLIKILPVVALACPNARFQPIYVKDVARAFVDSLDQANTFGRAYDLCGPRIYTLRELVELIAALLGKRRPIISLGDRLSYLQAWLMEWLPIKLMTRDNYYSMQVDSVCNCEFPFDFEPSTLESVVPEYLVGASPRSKYALFRHRAGR